ncbi:MAG: DUF169 domain-containing protein [Candidatus Bathyarchaeota archaeon]|nr:DUF169 domain-containing protein [Candidatus Bathyarchaeota archaeon]
MSKFSELNDRLNEFLKLNTPPVAIKLFKSSEEMKKYVKRRPRNKIALCQMLGQSRYIGRVLGGTAKELDSCALGVAVLGFTDYPEDIAEGKRFKGLYHRNEDISKKVFAETPRFEVGVFEGILSSPLSKSPIEPDLIIFFGNSAQIARIVHGYVYGTGERLVFSTSGETACADAIIPPILTGKPSITLPCNGARILSAVQDSEMIISVPMLSIESIIEGMKKTHEGGIRYPPTFQITYISPQPPVSHFIGMKPPELRE